MNTHIFVRKESKQSMAYCENAPVSGVTACRVLANESELECGLGRPLPSVHVAVPVNFVGVVRTIELKSLDCFCCFL